MTERTKKMTLREAQVKGRKYGYSAYKSTYVNTYNRSWNKNLTKLPCQKCNYDKHIDLCHIKPIRSFSLDTTLGEINSPENNLVLCLNHHWEFDHGILDIKDISKR
ncbi:MAG TPA: HNH endonuclease signature motif containing protein [Patescibacteria group bacterium]|nr:HNH endonuclease signature motif containing protein [Patescibacteria group bacterium]